MKKTTESNVCILTKNRRFLLLICILLLGALIFVFYSWNKSIFETENEARKMAETAEAGISNTVISNLDLENLENISEDKYYIELRNALKFISSIDHKITFSYVLLKQNNQLLVLADSEPYGSEDYSPPGDVYFEATEDDFSVFEYAETVITRSSQDRWGVWKSVLVPIFNDNNQVIAAFGIDYDIKLWYKYAVIQTIYAVIISLALISLVIAIYFFMYKNEELEREKQKLIDSDEKLKESETLFRSIFEQATIGISIGNSKKNVAALIEGRSTVNPMFQKILKRNENELMSINWQDITHPMDIKKDIELFEKFQNKEIDGYDMEKRYLRPDGTYVWVHMIISSLDLENLEGSNHLCLIEDITRQKEVESSLLESERSKSVILNNLMGMAYRCRYDQNWTMEFVSKGCKELTGYSQEELIENKLITFNDIIVEKYRPLVFEKWSEKIRERKRFREEYQIRTSEGNLKWVFEQGQAMYDETGEVLFLEGLIVDITENKEKELKLKYITEHNMLTGICNRVSFEKVLRSESSHIYDKKRAVILVNVEKFNLLNITYGYFYAENIIKLLGAELQKLNSDIIKIFHIAIDRFLLYLDGYKEKSEIEDLCKKINQTVSKILERNNIRVSVGVVELESNFIGAEDLLKKASIAVDGAFCNKEDNFCYFNSSMEKEILRKEAIKNELALVSRGIGEESLILMYQPIINLNTNEIYGFEALTRFKSKSFGFISPLEFIPIAEETQLIVPLGKIIMIKALEFLYIVNKDIDKDIKMSINVSGIQLLRDDFFDDIKEIILNTGVLESNIKFEITESFFSNDLDEINKRINILKAMGIFVAIDDFGTGYSSLSRERELDVDCLKIDKSFIDTLLTVPEENSITGDIISMAHKMGHYVVAEGVENESQKAYLVKHNCDFAQGYLYSKPLLSEDALRYIKEYE